MKLLAFVDLHADAAVLKKLVERAQKKDIDLIVCAGDFSVFENHMDYVLKKLDAIGKQVLMIPGNHETPERLRKELAKYKNLVYLHEQMLTYEGWLFFGWGTDGFSRHSEQFRKVAREWRRKLTVDNTQIVLVTHAPPSETKLDELSGEHVGNVDIRTEIERIKPHLVICGHLHENEGKVDKVGVTKIVNPGWKGMVIELK